MAVDGRPLSQPTTLSHAQLRAGVVLGLAHRVVLFLREFDEPATSETGAGAIDKLLLGVGPVMQQLRCTVSQIATASKDVLLTGETGSGKEVVARAIHATGADALSPFVPVNMAAIPETLFTVWHNVFERGWARDGESLLVHGGTSGIGTMAIQLAKAFEMQVVATAGSEEKCQAIRDLGADLAVNYKTQDFVEEVKSFTGGKGVDVVLDMVSGDYVARNIECLAEDGRHVTIAVLGGLKAQINMATVMRKRLVLTGSTLRPRSDEFKALLADEIYNHAWPLFEEGAIAPVMDRSFPLAEAGAAHAHMEAGDHIGKIVLEVGGE